MGEPSGAVVSTFWPLRYWGLLIYAHMYTHVHTYDIHAHNHACMHRHTCIFTLIHVHTPYTHLLKCSCTHTYTAAYIHTHIPHTCIHSHIHYICSTPIYTHTLMNTHTPTYTHAHICTHIPHSFTCLCTHMRAHAHNTHLGSYVHGCPASRVMYCCHRSVTLWKESWKYN